MKRATVATIASSALVGSLLLAGIAFAQTPQPEHGGGMMGRAPGVFGTVSAISGNTLTVESRGFGPKAATTTYTVNASSATVTKNNAATSISGVSVGDMIMVQGTVSGTSVTATAIRDGMPQGEMKGRAEGRPSGHPSSTPAVIPQGNGQPVVGGAVTAVNGSTITITNKSNVTYTVDASSATVTKGGQTSSLANISVGDNLIVQGSISGSSVTASSIIDQGTPRAPERSEGSNTATSSESVPQHQGFVGGFLGGMGDMFHRIFGFF